ncbi:MAG: DUF1788 domain-containing protein [Bacteroidetes bacterium]|nr:DUF1788 domain-containing protein [Bacteroidota bacterium]
MKLSYLFEELSRREFQNPDTGNMFFPAYIYCYEPQKEYQIRKEILELKDRLIRPDIFQECMVINIYTEFIDHLMTEKLGDESLFDLFIKQEKEESATEAGENLKNVADSIEFLKRIDEKIRVHFQLPSKYKKVYVLVQGFGSIFPYLSASEFLKRFEEYVSGGGYKIVVFYPGKYENNHFYLFNEINHESIYRASLLNK